VIAALGTALVLAAPGYAAFPGLNGKIAFERPGTSIQNRLLTINPDGTGEAVLPTTNDYAGSHRGPRTARGSRSAAG
jgi:hypothetical protein